MMYILLIALFTFHPVNDPLKDKNYKLHAVEIERGDGVFSLLRRYKLSASECNIEQFYQLNNLGKNASLIVGQKYVLPVYIFTYNGKSIRSSIGIDDWDLAVRVKEYNEFLLIEKLRLNSYVESNILWVPHNLLFCQANLLETKENVKTANDDKKVGPIANKNEDILKNSGDEPIGEKAIIAETVSEITKSEHIISESGEQKIFGDKYENYKIIDHKLKDVVYYVVSGHGGIDPGAVCTDCEVDLCEDEYAYDVVLRLARNLLQHGATVEIVVQDKEGILDNKILRCDTDEKLADGSRIPGSQRVRLKQRTVYVNEKYTQYKRKGIKQQYLVEVHVDSRSKDHEQDVFFCYYGESNSAKRLSQILRQKFDDKYTMHQKDRGYHGHTEERAFYVLMNTLPTATLIELANIKNKSDHRRILIPENRQAVANWIFEGLVDFTVEEAGSK